MLYHIIYISVFAETLVDNRRKFARRLRDAEQRVTRYRLLAQEWSAGPERIQALHSGVLEFAPVPCITIQFCVNIYAVRKPRW